MIEILPIGGMNEVGRNMTAIGFDGEYIVVDMGIRLDSIIGFDDVDIGRMSRAELINLQAIPDDTDFRGNKVKAILLSHGHLDHIGAVGKLATSYNAPIYGTPYTIRILKKLLREEHFSTPSQHLIRAVPPKATLRFDNVRVEFIPVTHSILHTVAIAIHHENETVLVASDFKLDEHPLLGPLTDTEGLCRLRKDNNCLIALVGSVRADEPGTTPSEAEVRDMLKKVMEESADSGGLLYISTFSSHMARLKSIVDLSYELGRTPVMVGRSLKNYCSAATELGLVEFPRELEIYGRPNTAKKVLKRIGNRRQDYVIICTGHQGEPTSVLTRIADGKLPPRVRKGDHVIFSSSVIPSPINQANRAELEAKLEVQGAEIHRDVHASGHAKREDIKKFLKMVAPDVVVPCHGTPEKLHAMATIAAELGYAKNTIHLLKNGTAIHVGG